MNKKFLSTGRLRYNVLNEYVVKTMLIAAFDNVNLYAYNNRNKMQIVMNATVDQWQSEDPFQAGLLESGFSWNKSTDSVHWRCPAVVTHLTNHFLSILLYQNLKIQQQVNSASYETLTVETG